MNDQDCVVVFDRAFTDIARARARRLDVVGDRNDAEVDIVKHRVVVQPYSTAVNRVVVETNLCQLTCKSGKRCVAGSHTPTKASTLRTIQYEVVTRLCRRRQLAVCVRSKFVK